MFGNVSSRSVGLGFQKCGAGISKKIHKGVLSEPGENGVLLKPEWGVEHLGNFRNLACWVFGVLG